MNIILGKYLDKYQLILILWDKNVCVFTYKQISDDIDTGRRKYLYSYLQANIR